MAVRVAPCLVVVLAFAFALVLVACGGRVIGAPSDGTSGGAGSSGSSGSGASSGAASSGAASSGSATSSGHQGSSNGDVGASSSGGGSFVSVLRANNDLCLPQPLQRGTDGLVRCSVIAVLASAGPSSDCSAVPGLSAAPGPLADAVRAAEPGAFVGFPMCVVQQLRAADNPSGTCVDGTDPGWCYVEGAATDSNCEQAHRFSKSGQPEVGASLWIACQ